MSLQSFDKFKETKRALLREKQAQEIAELEEKLMEKRFVLMRANDSHRKTCVAVLLLRPALVVGEVCALN